jgi:thiol-disulfide isomerase/thioredoxin
MSPGAWVAVLAVALACAIGCLRVVTDGRFRGGRRVTSARRSKTEGAVRDDQPRAWARVRDALPDAELGDRATLLQFSTAFCAPCRTTRRVLTDVAEAVPGVVHLEIDAEHHLDLVRALGITRTPTTVLLDASGAEVARASGAPRKEQVVGALAQAL